MICKPLNNCTTERRFQKGRIQGHAIGFPLPCFLHRFPPVIQRICLHHTCYFVDGDSLGGVNRWACRHANECSHSLTAEEEGKNRLTLGRWLFIQATMKSMNSPPLLPPPPLPNIWPHWIRFGKHRTEADFWEQTLEMAQGGHLRTLIWGNFLYEECPPYTLKITKIYHSKFNNNLQGSEGYALLGLKLPNMWLPFLIFMELAGLCHLLLKQKK